MLTIAFIAVFFIHTITMILTRAGRAFVDVNLTVIVHDAITAARHAAADVDIRSHELTQLIDQFSCHVVAQKRKL